MGTPLKEQLEHRHSAADPASERCHGSGWLTALVDDPDTLANIGSQAPCAFVMACSECSVYDGDYAAITAARRAGMTVNLFGVVAYAPAQLQVISNDDREAAIAPEGLNYES